jgi:probable phosphoglycerate mutase
MKLFLVRHGQSDYNVLHINNSDPSVDVHLTELGRRQAKILAEHLKHTTFEFIYASELRRTQQTANIINAFHSVPVVVDGRLNDNRSGFEGKPSPDHYAALAAAADKWNVRFNGGESIEDVKLRITDFLNDLKESNYSSVLVVTSMIIIQAMYGIIKELSNEEWWQYRVDTGSWRELEL